MKFALLWACLSRARDPCGANPVNRVIQHLTGLESKIEAEGWKAHRVHGLTPGLQCAAGMFASRCRVMTEVSFSMVRTITFETS